MPEQQEILCDNCGQRPACVFSTQCTAGEIVGSTSLCEVCADEDPALGLTMRAMECGCVYCGSPAMTGSGASGSFKAMCGRCADAAHEFVMKAYGANSQDDLLSVLKAMSPEARAEGTRAAAKVEEYLRTRRV